MKISAANSNESQDVQNRDPVIVAGADTGVGKTEVAINAIVQYRQSRQLSAANDNEPMTLPLAIYAVPTHRLADELVGRFENAGLSAGIWRGRMADHPTRQNEKMCQKPEQVRKVTAMGLGVARTMCRLTTDDDTYTCDDFSICAYQQQVDELSKKDVVIVAHASLFHEKPDFGKPRLLVIDESFYTAGLRGV